MALPRTGEWADIFYIESHGSGPDRKHQVFAKSASGKPVKVFDTNDFELAFKGAESLNEAYRYGVMVGKESCRP